MKVGAFRRNARPHRPPPRPALATDSGHGGFGEIVLLPALTPEHAAPTSEFGRATLGLGSPTSKLGPPTLQHSRPSSTVAPPSSKVARPRSAHAAARSGLRSARSEPRQPRCEHDRAGSGPQRPRAARGRRGVARSRLGDKRGPRRTARGSPSLLCQQERNRFLQPSRFPSALTPTSRPVCSCADLPCAVGLRFWSGFGFLKLALPCGPSSERRDQPIIDEHSTIHLEDSSDRNFDTLSRAIRIRDFSVEPTSHSYANLFIL